MKGLRELLALVGESWRADAKCLDADPGVFFPEDGRHGDINAAFAICARCPVRVQCREYAIAHEEPYGVWGGTTPKMRAHERAQRQRGRAA